MQEIIVKRKVDSGSTGDIKPESRTKARRTSLTARIFPSPNLVELTASYNLHSETARLYTFIGWLKDGNYSPGLGDRLQDLRRLLDCTCYLQKVVFETIEKEQDRLSKADLEKLAKTQNENLEETKKQQLKDIEGEKLNQAKEHAVAIEGLTTQQNVTLQELEKEKLELEKEKEKNICQICFTRSRNAVVLTCMHYLYCNACLEAHKLSKHTNVCLPGVLFMGIMHV